MSLKNDIYKHGDVIINITGHDFGGLLKMGDIIATLNVLQYMREINDNQNIKFYIPNSSLQPNKDYVISFRNFLIENSNYISKTKGNLSFVGFVEIWSFRELHQDLINIKNDNCNLQKKICIFPLIDAYYNTERNFSNNLFQKIIDSFSGEEFNQYQKFICLKGDIPLAIQLKGFELSSDFDANLIHATTCEYFVGGDTGVSHLVGAMNNNPNKKLSFYYKYGYHGGWASSFTAPFQYNKENVKMIYFNEKSSYDENDTILQNLICFNPFMNKIRIGIKKDGGYVVVQGYEYDFIISGGVGSDISFELEFMNMHPQVKGLLFDGTVEKPVLPNNLTFINKNIGHANNLIEYIKNYNDVFLKLDIEGGEWELLSSPFVNYLHKIKQIVIEVHNIFSNRDVVLNCLKAISKTHNIVHVHENNNCRNFVDIAGNKYPDTIELTYLRKDCRVWGLNEVSFPIEGIDFPNANYSEHNINFYPFNIKTNK